MIQSFPRWSALVLATAALAFTSSGAFAQASITISDTNCSDFALGGTPGNRTLTCVVSSAPVCTVTGPSTGTSGSPITLTASCAPAPTSWAWTGGSCASTSTSSICLDTQTGVGPVQYTVKGTNGIGPGNISPPFTVTWANTPPAAPSNCSISGAPSGTQAAGVSVTLTMNCSGGGQATSWAWSGGQAAGKTTQSTGAITVNSTTTFTATASNAGGTSAPPAAATVTIGGGGGGGGGGPISCTGFNATHVIDIAWPTVGTQALVYTANAGGFGPNDAVVVRFTTPSNIPGGTTKGYIQGVEYGDSPSARIGSLSTQPCEFGFGLGVQGFANTIAPWVYFALPGSSKPVVKLAANTQYFFNIMNAPGSTCQSTGSCNMQITFVKPSGS